MRKLKQCKDKAICKLVEKIADDLEIKQPIDVCTCEKFVSPTIVGYFHPRLILPAALIQQWNREQLKPIVYHELNHVVNKDHFYDVLVRILGIFLWFFPGMIWFRKRLEDTREFLCDARAYKSCDCPQDYASLLLRLGETILQPSSQTAFPMVRSRKRILSRFKLILAQNDPELSCSLLKRGLIMIPCLAVCISLGSMRFVNVVSAQESQKESTSPILNQGFTLRQFPKKYFPAHHIDIISMGLPTNDGRYVAGRDYDSLNLVLRNLTSGKDTLLTHEGTDYDVFSSYERAENSAISPAVDTVAYSWGIKKSPSDFHAELRLVDIDGKNQRVLLADENLVASVIRWSKDGKSLFCQLRWNEPERIEFALVSVEDGSKKVLKTVTDSDAIKGAYVDDRYPAHLTFLSPDEKYLAYTNYPNPEDSWNSDIAIWSIKEQKEYPFVVHSAMDKVFGWSPDGKWIVFSSNRLSTNDIYIVPFSLDSKANNPTIVTRGLGQIHPIGITSNGRMYFSDAVNLSDVYTATIDWDNKTITEDSESISESIKAPLKEGKNWSPDGKYYSFEINELDYGVGNKKSTWIYSYTDKISYKIPMNINLTSRYWMKDSRSIFGAGTELNDPQRRLYKIDIKSGAVTVLKGEPPFLYGQFTSDMKILYRPFTEGNEFKLVEYNRETQAQKTLYEKTSEPNTKIYHRRLTLSPDEKWLICRYSEESINFKSIRLFSTENGEHRDIYEFDDNNNVNNLLWLPDSKSILISQKNNDEDNRSIWKVSITGEPPEKIGSIPKGIQAIGVHPSGNKLAYTKYVFESSTFMMENFLPEG